MCTGHSHPHCQYRNWLLSLQHGASTTSITVNQAGLYSLTVTYPEGCTKTASQAIGIVPTPAPTCNNLVQVSLDEDCSVTVNEDMVLEGTYYCDYDVEITGLNGMPNYGNTVTAANIGQTLKVTVTHILSGNSCSGFAKIEDKLPPVMNCQSFHIACAETNFAPNYLTNVLGLPGSPLVTENCSNYSIDYYDNWEDLQCDADNISAILYRTWTATDVSGNTSSCVQAINLESARLFDVVFPSDVTLDCTTSASTSPSTTGTPSIVFDYPFGPVQYSLYPQTAQCEISTIFVDVPLPVCDGTNKIIRTWTIFDWCLPTSPYPPTSNPLYFTQVIKVVDESGPVFDCPSDLTVSTDGLQCCATFDLPDMLVTDNCSRINSALAKITTFDELGQQTGVYEIEGILFLPWQQPVDSGYISKFRIFTLFANWPAYCFLCNYR